MPNFGPKNLASDSERVFKKLPLHFWGQILKKLEVSAAKTTGSAEKFHFPMTTLLWHDVKATFD